MKKLFVFVLLVGLAGCATAYTPIVDRQSIADDDKFAQDLRECQGYAAQIDPGATTGAGMITGAAVGAGIGALVAAFFGVNVGQVAGFGAALGGASGAARGAAYGMGSQRDIVIRCMQGRGYTVLH